jgi:uncharacterized membrane protein YkvA (DUF1232 family)
MLDIYLRLKEFVNKIIRTSKFKVYVLWFALKHQHTPKFIKLIGFLILIYILSPIDLIPDFIPILGYLDEVILITILVSLSLMLIPRDILDESVSQAKECINRQERLPKNRYGILLILAIWLGISWYIFTRTGVLSYLNKHI